ncbi:MAG: YhcH/YjgK/YiaL family protein [Lachnospiraceae bacterium]|nr:YhcH/YjgK/YiaL family protein [Lachnospiraceae bacterium]
MSPHLDKAIDFLLSTNLDELPLGKTVIDGDNVYVNKMEAATSPLKQRKFEIHKNYMDIQVDVIGAECIDIGDGTLMEALDEYNECNDLQKVAAPTLACCTMGAGNFVVCIANEPHKPNIQITEDTAMVKCVVKVRA